MLRTRSVFLAWAAPLLAALIALPRVAIAADGPADRVNLAGRVLERSTDAPVAGAMVKVVMVAPDTSSLSMSWARYRAALGRLEGQFGDEDGLVAYADSSGRFAFRGLPSGRVTLTFPNAGFAPAAVDETIRRV